MKTTRQATEEYGVGDIEQLVKDLNSLIQLDIDAYMAYGQSIREMPVTFIKERLSLYREDHKNHADTLSEIVRGFHGEPPKFSPDMKGFLIQGMTAIQSKIGAEGALKAMETNEKLTNDRYSKAVVWDVPQEVKTILERNYDDERKHLAFIKDELERKRWKSE